MELRDCIVSQYAKTKQGSKCPRTIERIAHENTAENSVRCQLIAIISFNTKI